MGYPMKTNTWRFVSYDVWGNAESGWEVNQAFTTRDAIELPEEFDETAVFAAIREAGLCDDTSKLEIENVGDWEDILYLSRTEDGYPEGEFRKVTP